MTESLIAELEYSWVPFTVGGTHLEFTRPLECRLERERCSHWGPAVYKWEGPIGSGPNAGKTRLLIGETDDLRQRINMYVSGTQERGNKRWRKEFLALGKVSLFVLLFKELKVVSAGHSVVRSATDALSSANMRLVLEQLLVMQAVAARDSSTWIVNARQ